MLLNQVSQQTFLIFANYSDHGFLLAYSPGRRAYGAHDANERGRMWELWDVEKDVGDVKIGPGQCMSYRVVNI